MSKRCPFSPLDNRVFFEEIVPEQLIELPAGVDISANKKLVVLAVGPGRLQLNPSTGEFIHAPMNVEVGDRITLTNQAPPNLSAHKIGDSEDDVIFSLSENFIAAIVDTDFDL